MDLTVLELGLRNRQISTVKCFLKIQIETFRLFLSVKRNELTESEQKCPQFASFLNDWEEVFSKLIIVISANITDRDSHDFAICLARTALQSCNQLLIIIESTSEIESQFYKLFMRTIRSIRLSLKVQENDNKRQTIESIKSKSMNWSQNTSELQILSDSLQSNSLILAQHWFKKQNNLDLSWNYIIRNVILLALNSLRTNDLSTLNLMLSQLGLPVKQIIHKIYISTSDYKLRQMLVNKFNAEIASMQGSDNQIMSKIEEIVNSDESKPNISLTISWINEMGEELQQRAIILPLFRKSATLLYKNLSPMITWNYLIDRNNAEMLTQWVAKIGVSDVNTFPYNWTINQSMIESICERASVLTKELVLNALCIRGSFCLSEFNDFQRILHRFGRTNSITNNTSYSPEIFIDKQINISSLKDKVFTEKMINYCVDHKLYEFLFLYSKQCSDITTSSLNNSLTNLLKSSLNCSQNPSNGQILENILLTHQYIDSVSTPVTINTLMDSGNLYLALISLTYSSLNFFDICNNENNYLSEKPENPKSLIASMFKTEYPMFYNCFSELSNSRFDSELSYEPPTVYQLLKDSVPFDVSKMFCWQSLNNFECNEDYITSMVFNELPHFSQTKLADLYGLKASLTFTYYLNQGRVVEAYNKFITNRKVLNTKSIELACRRAALVAYNDTTNNQIAVACVVFQQLLSGDSTQTLIHLKIANIIMSFAADFLSLNSRQQQIELSNLLKRSHYYSDKRAAAKLLQLTVAAITRKYTNFMNIQIEECFDWKFAVKFAALHSLDPPLDFLTKCAVSDNWLIFTICCQIHEYPKESVFNALKFNNECISDHLKKAFQSSHTILAENQDIHSSSRILNKTNGRKNTSAKHLRNVLYSKIGLNKKTEMSDSMRSVKTPLRISTSPIENDDMSIASETDYNGVETISVLSSSNTSDNEDMPKFSPENAPKDLFQVILSCQTDSSFDARKALMYSSIPLSNPIMCLIACSLNYELEKFNIFSTFSCWLLASVDFEIRKQFCENNVHFDPLNWTFDQNYKMLDLITRDIKSYFIFLKGLKLFNMNITPLIDLLNFMDNFFCQKSYYEVQSLKSFQDNLWKYEEPKNTDNNTFFTKLWIQNASVIILTNALRNAKTYELIVLLRHYDFARIQGSFSSDIKVHDFRKLYRLSQCLSETDVVFPIGDLLTDEMDINSFSQHNDHYCSVIKTVISNLQQKGHFQEARNFANSAEIDSIDLTITEWVFKASTNMNSIEFWEICWESLIAVDTSLNSAFKVLNKFISQVSSVVVKSLLVFKCLIAAQSCDNHTECTLLETMLWKCVVEIEGNPGIKDGNSQWNKIWTDIIGFMKTKKDNNKIMALDSVDSSTMNGESSKSLDLVIGNLINNGCIGKAHEVALLFKYNHQDLDIILTCDNLAKGLIKNLSEAPLSVQLKTKAIGQLKKSTSDLEFTEEQKEKIGFIESISSLASIGQKACQRILLYFKISCVLSRNYSDIESSELNDLEILKCLIGSHSHNSDALSFAKELITLNEINDEDIASIVCKEMFMTLRSSLSETPSESSFSSSEAVGASFLSLVRLLNDTTILGIKLLNESEKDLLSNSINYVLLAELYIKAHECFTLACDVKGIAHVLRKSRVLITQNLVQLKDFNSILRLMTGIGRYSEMTYCFDILKENNQFELLLTKRIEKAPQLRIALLDYLKGDKEMYPLVALRFCLFREIAENHEMSAKKLLNTINFQFSQNIISYKEILETILYDLIDAQEFYCKAGSHTHADNCAKTAQLIALQIHYLPLNIIVINLKGTQIAQFIEHNANFYEALIVADAYQHHSSWANAVFNNVIINKDWNYLSDYTTVRDMSLSLVEELVQKYTQQYTQQTAAKNWTNEKSSQMRKSMQKLIQYIDDYESRFRIASKLGLIEITDKMLSEESGAYLQDLRRNGYL